MQEGSGKEETAHPPRTAEPAPAPPGERTALIRRSATRGLAGLLAIVLVVVIEGIRRSGETPATAPKAQSAAARSSLPPTAATLSPSPRGAEGHADSSLEIAFEHGLKSGTLALFVDDEKLLEQELTSQVAGKVLGFTRRRGRLNETLAVRPGRHQIRIDVAWPGKQRSSTVVGTFKEGAARHLVVRLVGITKGLSVEWE